MQILPRQEVEEDPHGIWDETARCAGRRRPQELQVRQTPLEKRRQRKVQSPGDQTPAGCHQRGREEKVGRSALGGNRECGRAGSAYQPDDGSRSTFKPSCVCHNRPCITCRSVRRVKQRSRSTSNWLATATAPSRFPAAVCVGQSGQPPVSMQLAAKTLRQRYYRATAILRPVSSSRRLREPCTAFSRSVHVSLYILTARTHFSSLTQPTASPAERISKRFTTGRRGTAASTG